MSKMGDMYLEIQEMLEDGVEQQTISKVLNVPMSWVEEVRQTQGPLWTPGMEEQSNEQSF